MKLNHQGNSTDKPVPLLVDLDGTLIATDSLVESILSLVKLRPWLVLHILYWRILGKTHLKRKIFEHSSPDIDLIPVRNEVLKFVKSRSEQGVEIVLCTGAWFELSEKFLNRFPFFDSHMASTQENNLTGNNKARAAVKKFGVGGYDYIGNDSKDLPVWKDARKAIVVGNNRLRDLAEKITEVEKHFVILDAGPKVWLKALRIHQWAKNGLVFVPLVTSHQLTNLDSFIKVLTGFCILGICASATYLFNDALDLDADRRHARKKDRPIAAGVIPVVHGLVMSILLVSTGIVLALVLIGLPFLLALICYLIVTTSYSLFLKRLQTVDVLTLASLFTIRVIAGSSATGVELSFWLLAFSMFMFLSLALVKRVSELIRFDEATHHSPDKVPGRGYFASDLLILEGLGVASGFMAVLVFALYINSESVVLLYSHPQYLWFICPVLGYWIMRIWILTARGQMSEDPIGFAITDVNSWVVAIISATTVLAASVL